MRRAAILCIVIASCGGKSGRLGELAFWETPPPDGTPVAVSFGDGRNGTELVIQLLAAARAAGATGVSGFAIKVGRCTREVAVAPAMTSDATPSPELERITMLVRETRYRCETHMDQTLVPDPKNPEGHFHETEMTAIDSCEHEPVEHVVTRYKFELDHAFTPPDWAVIRAWTRLDLRFGPPSCDAAVPVPVNAARLTVHRGGGGVKGVPAPAPAAALEPAATRARSIIDLARRARAAADGGDTAGAVALAAEALAAWGNGAMIEELDDQTAFDLAGAVAGAMFVAAEPEVVALLAEAPATVDAAWATSVGRRIDGLAARYEQIGDAIRVPAAEGALRAGAGRLAAIHRHVAEQLDAARMPNAAAAERDKAAALDRTASGQ
jgi:hypothetical protein